MSGILTDKDRLINAKAENTILQAKFDKSLAAIQTFCEKSRWGADLWKTQPHIQALFDIASGATDGKET